MQDVPPALKRLPNSLWISILSLYDGHLKYGNGQMLGARVKPHNGCLVATDHITSVLFEHEKRTTATHSISREGAIGQGNGDST